MLAYTHALLAYTHTLLAYISIYILSLQIYDGLMTATPSVTFCGYDIVPFESLSPHLRIVFHSDQSVQASGFLVTYNTVASKCPFKPFTYLCTHELPW